MEDREKELKVEERKEIEVNERKPQELPSLKEELNESEEKGEKLYEMALKYMEGPTLYEGLNRKLKEADRSIEERNNTVETLQKDKKEKKPSIIKKIWTKLTGFFKKLFGIKEPEVERTRVQDVPRVREEIDKAMENRHKLDEMYKPYANYPKFDGFEGHTQEIEELEENIPNKEEPSVEIPQKPITEKEYDIQMEEVDDGENA